MLELLSEMIPHFMPSLCIVALVFIIWPRELSKLKLKKFCDVSFTRCFTSGVALHLTKCARAAAQDFRFCNWRRAMTNTADIHQAFEAWMMSAGNGRANSAMFERDEKGDYVLPTIYATFYGWQAATERATPKWLPIDSAPRDGTWVLVTGGNTREDEIEDRPVSARYFKSGELWAFAHFASGYFEEYRQPTHWQALPFPPTIRQGGAG